LNKGGSNDRRKAYTNKMAGRRNEKKIRAKRKGSSYSVTEEDQGCSKSPAEDGLGGGKGGQAKKIAQRGENRSAVSSCKHRQGKRTQPMDLRRA